MGDTDMPEVTISEMGRGLPSRPPDYAFLTFADLAQAVRLTAVIVIHIITNRKHRSSVASPFSGNAG